jgi:hypothetical protein
MVAFALSLDATAARSRPTAAAHSAALCRSTALTLRGDSCGGLCLNRVQPDARQSAEVSRRLWIDIGNQMYDGTCLALSFMMTLNRPNP